MITFKSNEGRAYSVEIKSGAYSGSVEAGKAVVIIEASKEVPGKFDMSKGEKMKEPLRKMYIPKKYNQNSELVEEIKPRVNEISFDLKK
ncbi:hypothetical protein [Fimbriiglobus ruber]|uniref:Uncharacterized protein n=1 Tax=Fimbriiglobus ruber TaxID=1908690 RepID=A0A225DF20_9BACT|nr:hypothetical protein [Fimbriiglobus ruber]OWK34985.1 hypothetical protein FRUB_09827 [Fimbriiglobus ruber]